LDIEREKTTSIPTPNLELFCVKKLLGSKPKLCNINTANPTIKNKIPAEKKVSTGFLYSKDKL
jgi:hypothetical protein